RGSEAVTRCHLSVTREFNRDCGIGAAPIMRPEHSRLRAFSGKSLVSCPGERGGSPHLLIAPEHRVRESPQMAPGDSFATSGPFRSNHPGISPKIRPVAEKAMSYIPLCIVSFNEHGVNATSTLGGRSTGRAIGSASRTCPLVDLKAGRSARSRGATADQEPL